MARVTAFFVLCLLLAAQTSHAIQLHWSSGASDLTFTSRTRCILIVQADSAEVTLPSQWTLQWLADSLGANVVAVDSLTACQADTAKASSIELPSTPADSAAHQIIAHFCSDVGSPSTIAYFLLDQPGGSQGKLKVVALDPTDPDSSRVIESGEVTYNGGVDGSFPATVLRATSVHQSLELSVRVIGAGLSTATSMSIVALDSTWALPLTLASRSDTALTGVASVAALLPACQVSVGWDGGVTGGASLAPDLEPTPLDPESCESQFFEDLLTPPPGHGYAIQPKDFAFVRGFVDASSNRFALHLFYTRQSYYSMPADSNSNRIGHAWTTDFNAWYGPDGLNKPDTLALTAHPGQFDALHVWAPSIQENGPYFNMFYTGVRKEGGKDEQRIGMATSTDLNTWVPLGAPVLTAPDVPWASKNPSVFSGAQQLRDPFVMADPTTHDQWLMYFVSVDSIHAQNMAVGVAKSTDLVHWTAMPNPFTSTERATIQGATTIVESPHVFRHNGKWWMPYTVNQDQIYFETSTSSDPSDTVATLWTNPVHLRDVAEGLPEELKYWHASEHLTVNAKEYMAAFNDNATSIDIKGVFPPTNASVDSFLLTCPEIAGVRADSPHGGVRMSLTRAGWMDSRVGFRIELPGRMAVRLAVYDVAGRRRATLLDRELAGGQTEIAWDGRDAIGARVANGMYFARLTYAGGARVTKVIMLH